MIWRIRRSFSAKVIIWVLLITIPIFFVCIGVLYRQSRQMVRAQAEQRANVVLQMAKNRISRYLISAETATDTYAWLAEQNMQADSLAALTQRLIVLNPYVDGCAISTEPGVLPHAPDHFIAYSVREPDSIRSKRSSTHNYLGNEWYETTKSRREACWVTYYDKQNALKLDDEGMMATYNRPLFDGNRRFIGVISTEMSLLHLSKIMAEVRPYAHSYYMLIDEKGRYVGHPDSTRLFSQTIFSVPDPQKQADLIALGYEMTNGRQGHMSVVINGQRSMVCYTPVPGTPWSLGIVCPDSEVFQNYSRLTYLMVLLLFVGFFIIVVHSYKSVTVSIHPLNQLLSDTKAITEGHLNVVIPRTERKDVVGVLQNSFASMLESLNYYVDSVRKASDQNKRYNQELEYTTQLVVESEKQKTAFIQNVTHQVRTPLNIIMGFTQVLNNSSGVQEVSGDEQKNITATMKYNCFLLVRMVLMLFDSSKSVKAEIAETDLKEKVNISEAMRESITYTHKQYKDVPVGYRTNVTADYCILSNHRLLVYTVQELLNNAMKYSDRQNIQLIVDKGDSKLRFIVQDTGRGMADADVEELFKFFNKSDGFSEGLGLGLPLSLRHAQTLGGTLMVDETYKEGARLVLSLPLT